MAFTANPTGNIALSDAFADVQLPTIEVPGPPVLLFLALLTLASGAVFLIGGIMNFLQSADQSLLRAAGLVLSLPCVLLLVVALVGIIPFSLPDRMYPEFQLEKRRRLAAESAENTELTGSAPASASGGEQQRTPSDSTTTFAIPKTFPRSRATKGREIGRASCRERV